MIYSLACVVINTGYEGELKSFLTAVIYPEPIKTLKEWATRLDEYNDIVFIDVFEELVINVLESSADEDVRNLPKNKRILGRYTSFDKYFLLSLERHALVGTIIHNRYYIKADLTYRYK